MLSEHGIKIAPSIYYTRAKTPITLAELAEAYLVNALVDLHSADWASLGLASCGTRHRRLALTLARPDRPANGDGRGNHPLAHCPGKERQ
jgi:putative transposase